mgnify:CR=1 FL=1
MDQQMGLLDRLAQDALGRISAEEYPAKEWLEAMGYLLVPMQEDGRHPV